MPEQQPCSFVAVLTDQWPNKELQQTGPAGRLSKLERPCSRPRCCTSALLPQLPHQVMPLPTFLGKLPVLKCPFRRMHLHTGKRLLRGFETIFGRRSS